MDAVNLLNSFWLKDRFGNLSMSHPLPLDEHYFTADRCDTEVLPCFKNKVSTFSQRLGLIGIDHLAFSIPFSAFQRLDNDNWQRLPQFHTYPDTVEGLDQFKEHVAQVEKLRVEQFVSRVLGLRLGTCRSVGRFFYTHSHELLDPKRKHSVGFIAYGGNNDTVYFQISGKGCQYLFQHTTKERLHHWLTFFGVDTLTRLDLCYDDFDGNFTCQHAIDAYSDDGFKRSQGGRNPKIKHELERCGDEVTGEIVRIGSRQSDVYWRVYNKAKEQGIDTAWHRSEVELKKVSVDTLLAPAKFFAGICAYSASMNLDTPDAQELLFMAKRKVKAAFANQIKWLKRQCGRAIYDMIEDWQLSAEQILIELVGDCEKNGGRFSAPSIYADLVRS